jgi:hypothetical protein
MTWQPDDKPSGALTYGFTVSDSSAATELATRVAPDRILVQR